jgi:hypothetical protein
MDSLNISARRYQITPYFSMSETDSQDQRGLQKGATLRRVWETWVGQMKADQSKAHGQARDGKTDIKGSRGAKCRPRLKTP